MNDLAVIKNYWIHDNPVLGVLYNKSLNDIAEMLIKNKSYKISDILNSRGYWTYDSENNRKYLSTYDILRMIS